MSGEAGDLEVHDPLAHLKEEFKCDHCDETFGLSGDLKRHVSNVHLKERKFQCDECGKTFEVGNSLKKHVSTVHLKEKNFKCDECD